MTGALETIDLLGMPLARVDEDALLEHLFGALARGQGGWLVTANLDILRRFAKDAGARSLYLHADVTVADGMPLVWAAAVAGEPLPERVAGSALIYRFAERAAREGWRLFLLGGARGAAERAERELCSRYQGLRVCGRRAPELGAAPTREQVESLATDLRSSKPDLVLVALGSPKQELLIAELRRELPGAWFVGVGIAFSYVAGDVARAPRWMRRAGIEWVYRLAQEPRRLAKRYLVDDLPFAAELFARVALARLRR